MAAGGETRLGRWIADALEHLRLNRDEIFAIVAIGPIQNSIDRSPMVSIRRHGPKMRLV